MPTPNNTRYESVVPLSSIAIDPGFNTRSAAEMDENGLMELGRSIARDGLLQPVIIEGTTKTGFTLRAGHRRLAAINLWNTQAPEDQQIKSVRALIEKVLDEHKRDTIIAADMHSEKLSPLAFAELANRIIKREGMSQTDFAKIYGISVVYAGQLLTLADAPPEVKDAVDKDVISGTAAIELVRDAGPDGAVEVVEALTSQLPEVSPSTPVGTGSTSDTRPRSGARNAPKAFTGAQVREAANKLGKTRSSPAPKTRSPSKGTHLPSPERDTRISAEDARTMLQRFINSTDRLIAQHKKGIDTADTILNMAMTLRDAAILGVAAESRLTEIDANTPDEWFSW